MRRIPAETSKNTTGLDISRSAKWEAAKWERADQSRTAAMSVLRSGSWSEHLA